MHETFLIWLWHVDLASAYIAIAIYLGAVILATPPAFMSPCRSTRTSFGGVGKGATASSGGGSPSWHVPSLPAGPSTSPATLSRGTSTASP